MSSAVAPLLPRAAGRLLLSTSSSNLTASNVCAKNNGRRVPKQQHRQLSTLLFNQDKIVTSPPAQKLDPESFTMTDTPHLASLEHLLSPAPAPLPLPKMPSTVEFAPVSEQQVPQVLDLLHRNFFVDEPLNAALGLACPENHERLEDHVGGVLKEGLSIAATDAETGKLLGVMLNGVAHSSELDVPFDDVMRELRGTKLEHIFTLIHAVNARGADAVFGPRREHSRVFDMKILSTDRSLRKAGIATHLVRKTVDVAKENGFKKMKCEVTNSYSKRVAENVGLKAVAGISYADFVSTDAENGRLFKPFSHLAIKHRGMFLMAREL